MLTSGLTRTSDRATFITRTYLHLFGATGMFTLLEILLFRSGVARTLAGYMLGANWLLVLGAFMIVSWFATRAAHRAQSYAAQYMALTAFVVAEAIIFIPLLYMAQAVAPGVIQNAAFITLIGFTGLTAVAWSERRDFSFMGGMLKWAGVVALVLIAGSLLFGFHLGVWFSVAMVAFAGASILYDTSNILHHYPSERYVGAALQLFASVAMMFWYVMRLLMAFSRD